MTNLQPGSPPSLAFRAQPARLIAPSRRCQRSRVDADSLVVAILLGAVLVAAWPALVALRGPQPLQLPVVVAHVCGMLAGYGVLVLLLLMSRTPALERGVGADVLARWHGYGGRMVISLILVHAWAAVLVWAQSRQGGMLVAPWGGLRVAGVVAATGGPPLPPAGGG